MTARSTGAANDAERQRQQWDSVAAGWKKWWHAIENGAQHVSKRLAELAEVEPGQRVLDIATGIGEPALFVAGRVGPSGRVIGTDISPQMLAIARERAASSGLTNAAFIQADAEQLDFRDGSFDTVLCRWGLDSLSNPLNTLVEIRRMLTPGGAFATSVWDTAPRARPLAGRAAALAREMFELPSPRSEAPSSPGLGEDALTREMIRAGFTSVRVEKMTLNLELPSAEEFTQYLVDVSPGLAALLSDRSPGQQAEYRQRLAEALRPYVMADGSVRVPNVTVCAVGRVSSKQ